MGDVSALLASSDPLFLGIGEAMTYLFASLSKAHAESSSSVVDAGLRPPPPSPYRAEQKMHHLRREHQAAASRVSELEKLLDTCRAELSQTGANHPHAVDVEASEKYALSGNFERANGTVEQLRSESSSLRLQIEELQREKAALAAIERQKADELDRRTSATPPHSFASPPPLSLVLTALEDVEKFQQRIVELVRDKAEAQASAATSASEVQRLNVWNVAFSLSTHRR